MKKVWVNRFNADGLFKPMSEWKLKECNQNQSHAYKVASGNYAFNFECLPSRHCLITPQGENEESGVFFEFISNQRGDGWFYVADGDLPPHSYSENILAHTSTGEYAIIVSWLYNSRTVEVIYGKPICWQPIQQPKFIGECDV